MSTTTPNLTLTLYDSTTDQVVTFATFRAVWGGTATTSNFYRIDTWAGTVNSSITTLQNQRGAIPVPAGYVSSNYYEATVSSISSYVTGMTILLKLDTDSAGTVTLNINALGTKSVTKVNSSGSIVNITGAELQSNRYYMFTYDGTQWVWVNADSADQVYHGGTSGNVVLVASDGSISDSSTPATVVGSAVYNATAKTTLADADTIGITDSAASNVLKKITWSNFKTAIGTGLGAIINALAGKTTPVGADVISIGDSESTFASKSVLLSNLYKALGTGTQDTTTFLRGDGTYSIPNGGVLTNELVNGSFTYFQRLSVPSTPVAMTDNTYDAPDRWYSLIQGSNPTIAQSSGIGSSQYSCKLTAGGTTNRYGIAQIIKSDKSIFLRGKTVTFQILAKIVNNAGSGTRDYRVAVLEWTGTADTIGATPHDLVSNWTSTNYTLGNFFEGTTKTLVGTSSFTLTHNTETVLSLTGSVSSSCNNLIVFVWTEDAPTNASDYVLLGESQVINSSTTRDWNYVDDFLDCLNYCERFSGTAGFNFATGLADSTSSALVTLLYKNKKWRLPTSGEIVYGYSSISDFTIRYTGLAISNATAVVTGSINYDGHVITITATGTPLTGGQNVNGRYANTNAYILVQTEI